MSAFELMLDGSILQSIGRMIATPESYMGATTYIVIRKSWTMLSRLAVVLTAAAMVYEMVKKYPRYFAIFVIMLLVLVVLPGCASTPDFTQDRVTRQNTVMSRNLCPEYQQILIENRSTLVQCHADKAMDLQECQNALDVAARVRPAYRNCMEYEKDHKILPNPANVFTVPEIWRRK
uniref:Uncharacterized protein n=1 Tax=viral metagenome TaxID=1070528 RepID=A0A2V0RBC6_9ZZZZ